MVAQIRGDYKTNTSTNMQRKLKEANTRQSHALKVSDRSERLSYCLHAYVGVNYAKRFILTDLGA